MKELKDTLTSISKKVENYPINSGGCCLYAYLIAKELDKRNISYTAHIEFPDGHRRDYYDQAKNKNRYLGIHHIFLKINSEFFYDSDGIRYRWTVKDKIYLKINSKEILNLYNNGDWNIYFKKMTGITGIKKIKQIIKEEFNDYDERIKNRM